MSQRIKSCCLKHNRNGKKGGLDLGEIKWQFLGETRCGKLVFGKEDGVFKIMLKHFLEAGLSAKLNLHLDAEQLKYVIGAFTRSPSRRGS